MNDAEATPRKRVVLFRAQDATAVGPDTMVAAEPNAAAQAGIARLAEAGVGRGSGERSVVLFKEPGEQGFSLIQLWFKSGYILPPHSHDGDCLYYVTGGELRIGTQVLRKGDGMHIPAHCGYSYEAGPEGVEVLEFRNATRFGITLQGTAANWERIATVFRERAAAWENETVPPSERPRT